MIKIIIQKNDDYDKNKSKSIMYKTFEISDIDFANHHKRYLYILDIFWNMFMEICTYEKENK